ncbi:MAG: DNA invertase [Mesorhizobium sp.]|nr:MAG: DNA invertase [Mesorhizobium sp.]
MRRYVVYLRVSTKEQGKSGLGLEAQQRDIELFLQNYSDVPYEVVATFQDIGSGADNGRPELQKAIALAKKQGAELLVSKLDRLSRRLAYVATLMEDPKLKLRVASMPNADKTMLHVYSLVAEMERDFVSARTKAALAAAKARGKKLGGLRGGGENLVRANEARQAKAQAHAESVSKVILPLRDAGKSLSEIARTLDEQGIAAPQGGEWSKMAVQRKLARAASSTEAKVSTGRRGPIGRGANTWKAGGAD